jgi:RNA polymerase sigma factor (sigma-70 family)
MNGSELNTDYVALYLLQCDQEALKLFEDNFLLVKKRVKSLWRKYGKLLQKADVAFDDLGQELFLVAWNAALNFNTSFGIPFENYLSQRLTWRAIRIIHLSYRKNSVEVLSSTPVGSNEDGEDLTVEDLAVELDGLNELSNTRDSLRYQARLANLREAIKNCPLTVQDRQLLIWVFEEGVGAAEISKRLGKKRTAIQMRLLKALSKLRAFIGDKDDRR